jgi:hypothetical protein
MRSDDALSVTRRSVIQLTGAAVALPAAPFPSSNLENRRMSFTPKFVDLVRNTTTTTGTGDFALGPAVNGFTGFTQACQVGDCFYYSCLGVDKPAEREVGRGTLLAGGAISREPISGTKTNFTTGTKTIALITAAEWFTGMQAGGAGGASPAIAATRAELAGLADPQKPALMCEHGREGLFVWDGSNLSAKVAADSRQGLYVAPSSDASGSSGAWVRSFSGPADFRWFGALADCSAAGSGTDNTPAFDAARAALVAARRGWLHIPKQAAAYRFATAPAQVTDQIKITGDGWSENPGNVSGSLYSGPAQYNGTILCFDANVAGFRFVGFTDNPSNAPANEFQSASGSIVRDLMLYSAGGTGATAHGIATYVNINVTNVRIQGFAGSGVFTDGDGSGSAKQYGNTALSSYRSVSSRANKVHGFYVAGNNSSVINFIGCDSATNGGGGYVQKEGFGNQYVNCHAASNNASFGTPAGFSAAQRTQCTADWPNLSDANCGSWYIPGASDASVLSGCYTEGGGGAGSKCELAEAVLVTGGNIANIVNQKNAYNGVRIDTYKYYGLGEIYAYSGDVVQVMKGYFDLKEDKAWASPTSAGRLHWNSVAGLQIGGTGSSYDVCIRRADGSAVAIIGHNSSTLNIFNTVQVNNGAISWQDVGSFPGFGGNGNGYALATFAGGLNLYGQGSGYDVSLNNKAGATALRVVTGTTNVEIVGTVSASNLSGTNTGDQFTNTTAARLLGRGSAAGAGAAQELTLAGGLAISGTALTAAGALTPTSVASTGAVTSSSATAGIGYAAGSRGTVTQTTSKSTGVTLNSVAGDITLSAASIAANTTVSFVLTNSSIAANDTVILNHVATGTFGSYVLNAHGFAAGSCTIDVRNISAGALAEAIVVRFVLLKGG